MTMTREQEIALCDGRIHQGIEDLKRTARQFDRREHLVAALRSAAEDVADEIEQERDATAALERLGTLPLIPRDGDSFLRITGTLGD